VPATFVLKFSLRDATLTTVGSIGLQGVRQEQVSLGENVAVIGLGLVGQIVAQILKAISCRVIGIDLNNSKLKLASELGSDLFLTVKKTCCSNKLPMQYG